MLNAMCECSTFGFKISLALSLSCSLSLLLSRFHVRTYTLSHFVTFYLVLSFSLSVCLSPEVGQQSTCKLPEAFSNWHCQTETDILGRCAF